VMGRRLEKLREWLTPRRRLWTGIGLYAATIIVPTVSPGVNVSWLIGPAAVLLVGSFLPTGIRKR